jgi:protein-tyrosine phosphatase
MAEGLLRYELRSVSSMLTGLDVRSSGVAALVGEPADPTAIDLMAEKGIDISEHRARQIDVDQINWADLILVMERSQRDIIQTSVRSARGKIFRLGQSEKEDIPDPFRQPRNKFAQVFEELERGIDYWLEKIVESNLALKLNREN